tara:strand:- start:1641 stop:1976 length:336 start_codon:yes stop_codon:yes gene_type:complete
MGFLKRAILSVTKWIPIKIATLFHIAGMQDKICAFYLKNGTDGQPSSEAFYIAVGYGLNNGFSGNALTTKSVYFTGVVFTKSFILKPTQIKKAEPINPDIFDRMEPSNIII